MALKDNLVSVWCEAADPTTDEFGSNTLTNNNSVGTTTGKVGTAGTFTSAGSKYLSHADNADLSVGAGVSFTLACWAYFTTTGQHGLIGKWDGGDHEYLLYLDPDGHLYLFVQKADNSGSALIQAATLGTISTGTWYYVVAWYDDVAHTLNIQVNGGTVDSTSYSSGVRNGTAAFNLGAFGGSNWLDGNENQAAMWKRVLTAGERTSLYNAGAGLAYVSWDAGGGGQPAMRRLGGVDPAAFRCGSEGVRAW